jgi:hypothetical protein
MVNKYNDNLAFNDTMLGIIQYSKTTTISALDQPVFDEVLKEFRKVNTRLDFSEITIAALYNILKTLKNDIDFYQKDDIEIVISLNLTSKDSIILTLWSEHVIFPFRATNNRFYLEINLHDLNNMKSYYLKEDCQLSCVIDNNIFIKLKKIDSLLDYNQSVYNLIRKRGMSPVSDTIDLSVFTFEFNERTIVVRSKLINFYGEVDDEMTHYFLDIRIYEDDVIIVLANQALSLTINEFLETSNQDILDIIFNLFKIKKIPVSSISQLKDFLLIQEMVKIQ